MCQIRALLSISTLVYGPHSGCRFISIEAFCMENLRGTEALNGRAENKNIQRTEEKNYSKSNTYNEIFQGWMRL